MQIGSHYSPHVQLHSQEPLNLPFNGQNQSEDLARNANFPSIPETEKPEKSSSQDYQQGEAKTKSKGTKNTEEDSSSDVQERKEKEKIVQERKEVGELSARDREVRAHEQAHMAVGGQYAGAASYKFKRGPDGVNYAVSGEVPISTSKENTPQATIQKAQIIRRAALAPAEPSPQDRQVAARATALEAEARKELVQESRGDNNKVNEEKEVEPSEKPSGKISGTDFGAEQKQAETVNRETNSKISSLSSVAPGSAGGRLFQSIANSTLSSNQPGNILDQIA